MGNFKLPGDLALIFFGVATWLLELLQRYWHWMPLLILLLLWLVFKTPLAGRALTSFQSRISELTTCPPVLSDTDRSYLLQHFEAQKNRFVRPVKAAQNLFERFWGTSLLGFSAFNTSLLIALIYPIVVLLMVWVVTGAGAVGGSQILPELTPLRRAGMGLLFLAFPFGCLYIANYLPLGLIRTFQTLRRFRGKNDSSNEAGQGAAYGFAVIVAVTFAGAFAVGVSVTNPGAGRFAIAFMLGSVFSFLGALIGTVASKGSSRGVGAAAGIFALAGAVIVAREDVGAFVVALVCVMSVTALAGYHYLELRCAKTTSRRGFICVCLAALALLMPGLLAVVWFPDFSKPDILSARRHVFLVLFFFNLAPLLNALSDWLSLAATRWFLARYQQKPSTGTWVVYLVLDVSLALLLTGLLYTALMAVLEAMQHSGWGVDAEAIRAAFLADPWNPAVSWLTWMGISNFLPTLLHLATVAAVLWMGVDGEEASFLKSQVKKLDSGQALSMTDAQRLAIFFTARRWFGRGIGIAAVGGACVQWGQPALTWIVRWPIWIF